MGDDHHLIMTQSAHTFTTHITHTTTLDYLLSAPHGYNPDDAAARWPLILFLHGSGERSDHPDGLDGVKAHGLPKRLENKLTLPFFVVSPQCPADDWWSSQLEALARLLDSVLAAYPVDARRVYLTGLSMGGHGAWHMAVRYPERFAAVAPICGGLPWFIDLDRAVAVLKHMPLWVFHGAKDQVVLPEESQRMVKALRAAGGDVKFTLYRNAGHDSWTQAYANPRLYRWLLEHGTQR